MIDSLNAFDMADNATRAMCSMYGHLGVMFEPGPQYQFDPVGSGVCELISHVRTCEHEWMKPGECAWGLACFQIQIVLGHLLGCEDHKCQLCNDLCTKTFNDPPCNVVPKSRAKLLFTSQQALCTMYKCWCTYVGHFTGT